MGQNNRLVAEPAEVKQISGMPIKHPPRNSHQGTPTKEHPPSNTHPATPTHQPTQHAFQHEFENIAPYSL